MTWLKLDDKFMNHPKIAALSDSVFRFHMAALCYCAEYETDGFVSEAVLRSKFDPRSIRSRIKVLVETPPSGGAALWHKCDGGWTINGFLDFNPSREKLERERELGRQRKEKSRRDTGRTPAVTTPVTNGVTPGGLQATRPDPTRPVVSKETNGGEGKPPKPTKARKKATRTKTIAHQMPADWAPTESHIKFAKEHPEIDLSLELVKFTGHWAGKTWKSWDGAFMKWLAQAVTYAKQDAAKNGGRRLGVTPIQPAKSGRSPAQFAAELERERIESGQ